MIVCDCARSRTTVDDEVTLVDVDGGFGGQAQQFGMDVQVGTFQGLFLLFSLQGLSIPAGYFHLTTLQTASLEEAGCQPGTAGLVEVVISDPLVSDREESTPGGTCRLVYCFSMVVDMHICIRVYIYIYIQTGFWAIQCV